MNLLTADLTCQQAVELVTDYLEGKLTRHQRRRFERHLRGCDNCARYFEQMRETISLAGRVEPDALDSTTRQDLIDLYRHYRGQTDAPPSP